MYKQKSIELRNQETKALLLGDLPEQRQSMQTYAFKHIEKDISDMTIRNQQLITAQKMSKSFK
jgi:hypothetical protein